MKDLLTLAELAAETPYSLGMLYRLVAAGELAVIRRPGVKTRILVARSDWQEWLQRNRRPAKTADSGGAARASVHRASVDDLPGANRYTQ